MSQRVPTRRLRVLTLNCLFRGDVRARLRAIGQTLATSDVDVVCLQEVVWRRHVRLLGGLLTDHSHAAFQPFGPAPMGGLVIFSRVPLERRSYEVYRERGRWGTHGTPDRLIRKGFLACWLVHGEEPVAVVNTHLLASYGGDWSPASSYARQEQSELEQLGQAIRAIPAEAAVIVAGDFNVPAASPLFQEFAAACGLSCAFDWTQVAPGGRFFRDLDNVLLRPPAGGRARLAARLRFVDPVELGEGRTGFASDHVAVEADLAW